MRIVVSGATGLVGTRLVPRLIADGHTVVVASRSAISPERFGKDCETATVDYRSVDSWFRCVETADAVVHLAGANIFERRWSRAFMQEIRDSRVESTRCLSDAIARSPRRLNGEPKRFISGSAIGIYGDRSEETLTESSSLGTGFMADVGRDWEAAANSAREAGASVMHPRLGIVLDGAGGALPNLMRPFRFFVGGRVGSGNQFISWIHHRDLTGFYRFALEHPSLTGAVNAVSPNAVTNAEFSRTLGAVLHRPCWLPAPGFALRIALGRVSEVVTGSQRVVPERATAAGFACQFPNLRDALDDVCNKHVEHGSNHESFAKGS